MSSSSSPAFKIRRLLFAAVGFLLFGLCRLPAQDTPAEELAWQAYLQAGSDTSVYRIPGAADADLEVEIHLPAPRRKRPSEGWPVLLLVHGGGWGGGTRALLTPHARYFASMNWVCVNLSYRLTSSRGVTIAGQQGDVRAAFAWIVSEAGKRGWNATRISVLGESAGGQLACALGVLPPEPEKWRPRALILINPVLDLTSLGWTKNQPGIREAGTLNPASPQGHPAWLSSPLFHLTSDAPPIFILHGADDATVPLKQANAFLEKAEAVGARVELIVLPKTAHAFLLNGYGAPEGIRKSLRQITEFLQRN